MLNGRLRQAWRTSVRMSVETRGCEDRSELKFFGEDGVSACHNLLLQKIPLCEIRVCCILRSHSKPRLTNREQNVLGDIRD